MRRCPSRTVSAVSGRSAPGAPTGPARAAGPALPARLPGKFRILDRAASPRPARRERAFVARRAIAPRGAERGRRGGSERRGRTRSRRAVGPPRAPPSLDLPAASGTPGPRRSAIARAGGKTPLAAEMPGKNALDRRHCLLICGNRGASVGCGSIAGSPLRFTRRLSSPGHLPWTGGGRAAGQWGCPAARSAYVAPLAAVRERAAARPVFFDLSHATH